MPFEFPTAPALNDEYTAGGITYAWDGLVWAIKGGGDPQDYVLKAGDTMTGALLTTGVKAIGNGAVGQLWLSAGDTNRTGNLEWRMQDGARQAYMGWAQKSNWINFKAEDSCLGLYMDGGADIYMGDNSGLHWGSTSAKTDVNDFSEGICLYGYGGTSQFGFNITSGTLNASIQNAANKFDVNIGGLNKLSIQGTTSYLNTNFTMTGLLTVNTGIALSSAYLSCPEGSKIQFNSASMFISSTANKNIRYDVGDTAEHGMWVNGTKEFWVSSAGHGLRMPDSFATGLGVPRDDDGGVNMRETLIAMLAKIKALEAKLDALAQPRGRR
jgi:hypothetical protein